MNTNKPVASLSLDLDNEWSYLKTHGDAGWASFPSYLDTVVPRILEFLVARDLTITFFIVGQDAERPENRMALRAIADGGHEIGNHSYHHEPWMQGLAEAEIEAELIQAEACIYQATGRHPIGFRGPGYSCSPSILRVLARRGYLYDASTLPTFLGPLARAYYFMTATLSAEEKRERAQLFGTLRDGLRPIRPYRWRLGSEAGNSLVEIPVTTMPFVRVPIHFSYVLYLSGFSQPLALAYFRAALALCRLTGTQPSLLLHPLDFLDGEDAPALAFFPALQLPRERKLDVVGRTVDLLTEKFRVVTMQQHAEIVEGAALPVRPATV